MSIEQLELVLEVADDALHVEINDDVIHLVTDLQQGEPGSVDDLFKQNWIRFLNDSTFWEQLDGLKSINLSDAEIAKLEIKEAFKMLVDVVNQQADFSIFMKKWRQTALDHVLNLKH